jgi:hypothetical protein
MIANRMRTVSEASGLPSWVYKRDGRLVPFEADKISQAVFAAGEALGKPDAFLARELTDGVLHFLERETAGNIPTTAQIADLIVKVVRELGQPALSRAYAEGSARRVRAGAGTAASVAESAKGAPTFSWRIPVEDTPDAAARACLREYSLLAIFSRDLVAAHREGLLTLFGLEKPLELLGCTFDLTGQDRSREGVSWVHSRRSGALVQALLDMRRRAGSFLVIDGPEYALTPFASAGDLAKNSGELAAGLEATGLAAVINLNCSRPPTWADEQSEGPLFADVRRPSPPAHVEEYRNVLLDHLLRPVFAGRIRIDWHLGERAFSSPDAAPDTRLLRLVRCAIDSASLSFTFDRASCPLPLAEGIDRRHPAVLLAVGLNLPRLLHSRTDCQSVPQPRVPQAQADCERFLVKLTSLSKMAVSAAVQKRSFLRRHTTAQALARGFLLDRARLIVVPIGLERVVHHLTGQGMVADQGVALGQQIVSSLCANLRQAARSASLDVTLDGSCWSSYTRFGGFAAGDDDRIPEPAQVAGVTSWSPDADLKTQIKAAGVLHAAAEAGTAAVLIPHDRVPDAEDLVALLQYTWARTQVTRLRFLRLPHQQQQLYDSA